MTITVAVCDGLSITITGSRNPTSTVPGATTPSISSESTDSLHSTLGPGTTPRGNNNGDSSNTSGDNDSDNNGGENGNDNGVSSTTEPWQSTTTTECGRGDSSDCIDDINGQQITTPSSGNNGGSSSTSSSTPGGNGGSGTPTTPPSTLTTPDGSSSGPPKGNRQFSLLLSTRHPCVLLSVQMIK